MIYSKVSANYGNFFDSQVEEEVEEEEEVKSSGDYLFEL